MSRRTQIIDFVVTELKKINGNTDSRTAPTRSGYEYKTNVFNNVHRRLKFLNEINDFPTLCVSAGDEDKVSIGAGVRFGTMGVQIRGYVKSENSLDAAEDLADDIEFVINTMSIESSNATFQIVDARVDSIETDEGLFEPFGVVNIGVTISYEQAETV
mgnify:FL=1